jgi:hypothetical protein
MENNEENTTYQFCKLDNVVDNKRTRRMKQRKPFVDKIYTHLLPFLFIIFGGFQILGKLDQIVFTCVSLRVSISIKSEVQITSTMTKTPKIKKPHQRRQRIKHISYIAGGANPSSSRLADLAHQLRFHS